MPPTPYTVHLPGRSPSFAEPLKTFKDIARERICPRLPRRVNTVIECFRALGQELPSKTPSLIVSRCPYCMVAPDTRLH